MDSLRARVIKGRLVVDEPTDLPEGLVLDLVIDDEGDDLDDADRRKLEAALAQSEDDAKQGRVVPAADVLRELRRNR